MERSAVRARKMQRKKRLFITLSLILFFLLFSAVTTGSIYYYLRVVKEKPMNDFKVVYEKYREARDSAIYDAEQEFLRLEGDYVEAVNETETVFLKAAEPGVVGKNAQEVDSILNQLNGAVRQTDAKWASLEKILAETEAMSKMFVDDAQRADAEDLVKKARTRLKSDKEYFVSLSTILEFRRKQNNLTIEYAKGEIGLEKYLDVSDKLSEEWKNEILQELEYTYDAKAKAAEEEDKARKRLFGETQEV